MKKLFQILLVVLCPALLFSCAKEEIKPNAEPVAMQQPCDTCAIYCVVFTIQNPDHTFNAFLNNAPVAGNFEACTGDTIRVSMVQDCVANGGQCSQWALDIMRNGATLHQVTGEGSYLSHSYLIP